jgi:hypothetical protein
MGNQNVEGLNDSGTIAHSNVRGAQRWLLVKALWKYLVIGVLHLENKI